MKGIATATINFFKKAWVDPVGSKLIAASIIALAGAVYLYIQGGDRVYEFLASSMYVKNWVWLLLILYSSLVTVFVIFKLSLKKNLSLSDRISILSLKVHDESVSTVSLLQEAKKIAKEAKDEPFIMWIDSELKGDFEELPNYRVTYGELNAYNSYSGAWTPVGFDNSEMRELMTRAPNNQSIGSLEKIIFEKKDGGTLVYPHSPAQKQIISDALNDSFITDVRLYLNYSFIRGIVEAVRNKVLEWTISQEK